MEEVEVDEAAAGDAEQTEENDTGATEEATVERISTTGAVEEGDGT